MITHEKSLLQLLEELAAAVRAGDKARALQLEQTILQRLVIETADRAEVERQVRALLAELDRPAISINMNLLDVFTERTLTPDGHGEQTPRMMKLNMPVFPLPIPLPEGEGDDESLRGIHSNAEGVVYPVWFGTNRKLDANGGFGSERHGHTSCGCAEVFIPESHRFGETGNPWWQRLNRFELRDDHLRLQKVTTQQRAAFFDDIAAAMQAVRDGGSEAQALFFLHGFNVSFEEAAIRAAQIGFDLKIPGATAFFSWPSRGSVTAYPVDEATIEASERAITDFLLDFSANCGADRVHIIAHSMGNRGLLRALQRIAANAETQSRVKFGQIFLAAPDVDRDLFLDLARLYPQYSERTTLYASAADKAVHLSAKLHDAPRAGYFAPYTVANGVDTVAVPDFDVDLLGHGYFAQAEALLHDIYDLINNNLPPVRRQRIMPAADQGMSFWKLRK